jgi:AcrR family transcriptional regulator
MSSQPDTKAPKVRDAEATKARLLKAATDEFAAHGIAGARVDRIGVAADANKALIYTYFGNKDRLFDAVMDHHVAEVMNVVPFTPRDLPGYAGALFDFLAAHPHQLRLVTWHRLEREGSGHEPVGMRASLVRKAADIADAQSEGAVPDAFSPEDLLAFTMALAGAWAPASSTAPVTLDGHQDGPGAREAHEAHRAAVVAAVRRLTT